MMTTTPTEEFRWSLCEDCEAPIVISIIVGQQRWPDVEWTHFNETPGTSHPAKPELRIAIDATCPNCQYPEMGYAPQREEFACSYCGATQTERPKD